MTTLEQQAGERLDKIRAQELARYLLELGLAEAGRVVYQDREYLNLAGNDYLGLAADRDLVAAFYNQLNEQTLLARFGPGATGSRLMTGNHEVNRELEEGLSRLYAPGRVLVFNSGYHANIGILPALAKKGDLILADKLCHASLIDGMRLSRARVVRYPHLDYERLATLLAEKRKHYGQVFIVTESIFSMDGDTTDLGRLARLKEKFQAVLYVDEAHAVGLRGRQGLGLAEEQGVMDTVDLLVGTFGKAWAGQGAFVICSQVLREYLLNTSRSFIFTTGLPPVSLSWLLFVLEKIPEMTRQRRQVRQLADGLRTGLQEHGLQTGGSSHIVPVLIGAADFAVRVADTLRTQGFWVTAVRPPTVPAGTARLRLSLTAVMDWENLAPLPRLIAEAMEMRA